MKKLVLLMACLLSGAAFAKLPPLSDEAKLKADETKQKTAHGDKTSAYQLCKAQDKVAERYRKGNKEAGVVVNTPKCEDPGPFVYTPPAPPAAPAAPVAAASPAAGAVVAPAVPTSAAPAKK